MFPECVSSLWNINAIFLEFFSLRNDQAFRFSWELGFTFTLAWTVSQKWPLHPGELSITSLNLFFPTPAALRPQANFGNLDFSLPEIQSSRAFPQRREAQIKLLNGNVQLWVAFFFFLQGKKPRSPLLVFSFSFPEILWYLWMDLSFSLGLSEPKINMLHRLIGDQNIIPGLVVIKEEGIGR